jgi:hypothetical protein
VSKKKASNGWRWIEGAVLLLLILSTIMVGERLHQDALVKTAIGDSPETQVVPAVMSPGQRALKLRQKLREERLSASEVKEAPKSPILTVSSEH